jgi:hypothetical protein
VSTKKATAKNSSPNRSITGKKSCSPLRLSSAWSKNVWHKPTNFDRDRYFALPNSRQLDSLIVTENFFAAV